MVVVGMEVVLVTTVDEAGPGLDPGLDLVGEDPGPGRERGAGRPPLRGADVAAAAAPGLLPALLLGPDLGKRWFCSRV